MAHATRLKKANPNFNFNTANPIAADTAATSSSSSASSRRSSKRAKRSHDESFLDEEDSKPETPADEISDQPQGDDSTLVNNETQDDPTQDDEAQDDETQDNETQADGTQGNDFAQANDHAQSLNHQNDGQDQQPAGDVQIDAQAQSPVEQANNHVVYEDNHQGEPPMAQADYPAHADQLAMMQQGESFNHQFPQAP